MTYDKLTLTFSMTNAAFEDYPRQEAAQVLRKIAGQLENGHEYGNIKDVNGNTIGQWDLHADQS